jgi:Flp pilus assembly pilin Flp
MLKSFLKDETGAELAEYAVAVALLVAIGLVVYKTLGNSVNQSNSTSGSKMQTATFPEKSAGKAGSFAVHMKLPPQFCVS